MAGCKDCDTCTQSFVGKLGKAALAVSTAGLSTLPAAMAAPFKRRCPQCGHPMSVHEAAKVQIAGMVAQQQQVVVVQVAMPQAQAAAPARARCEYCHATFPDASRCPECGAKAVRIEEPAPAAMAMPVVVHTQPVAPAEPVAPPEPAILPWHQRPVVIVLALVFLAPLGIALAWWHKLWSQRTRTIVSVASGVFFLVVILSAPNDHRRDEPAQSRPVGRAVEPAAERIEPPATKDAAKPAAANGAAKPDEAPSRPARDLPPGVFVTKDGYPGALTKDKLDEFIALIAQNDTAAADQLVRSNTGVFWIKAGMEVQLVDTDGFLSSNVKLRKRGTLAAFWTVREAIER